MERDARWEKIAAGTGVAFVVAVLVSSFLVPQLKIDAPITKVAAHFIDHRSTSLWANWIGGLAAILVLWFAGTLVAYLRRHGAGRMATIAFGGAVAATGVGLLGAVVGGALIWMAGAYGIGAGAVRTLFVINTLSFVVIFFPLVVFVAATSMAIMRTASLPAWLWQTGAVVAVVDLAASTTWARSGFWAPGGAFNFVGFLVFAAWVLALSLTLWGRVGRPDEMRALAAERPVATTS